MFFINEGIFSLMRKGSAAQELVVWGAGKTPHSKKCCFCQHVAFFSTCCFSGL